MTEAGGVSDITLFTVDSPSGSKLNLQTREEAEWYESRRDRYLTDNAFPNVSDLLDLDRLLFLEVMSFRWGLWLTQGFDYQFMRCDEAQLKKHIEDYSKEVRAVKLALGIDKATRSKAAQESLSDYVEKLLERAKIFGYHRNEQYAKAVNVIYQLRSQILTMDRCNEDERRELDLSNEKIIDWFRTTVIPEWDELSDSFRKQQSIWIRQM